MTPNLPSSLSWSWATGTGACSRSVTVLWRFLECPRNATWHPNQDPAVYADWEVGRSVENHSFWLQSPSEIYALAWVTVSNSFCFWSISLETFHHFYQVNYNHVDAVSFVLFKPPVMWMAIDSGTIETLENIVCGVSLCPYSLYSLECQIWVQPTSAVLGALGAVVMCSVWLLWCSRPVLAALWEGKPGDELLSFCVWQVVVASCCSHGSH